MSNTTKFGNRHSGCILPHELHDANTPISDDYKPGEVKTYTLTPEEIEARYGHLKRPGHTGDKKPILFEYQTRKQDKEDSGIIKGKGRDKYLASIMETARKLLPKDRLGRLLAEGNKTNGQIGKENGNLPYWAVLQLKKEYWPDKSYNPDDYREDAAIEVAAKEDTEVVETAGEAIAMDEAIKETATTESITEVTESEVTEFSINDLVNLQNKLRDDIACIDSIISIREKMHHKISPGVRKLLTGSRNEMARKLTQIEEVFKGTVVKL